MERRKFLKHSLLSAGALSLGNQILASDVAPQAIAPVNDPKPVPQRGDAASDYLTTYIFDSPESTVWVRWKNNVLTCYRAEMKLKYPYFYPLRAMRSGLSLTAETSQPWPHHRSVFFGLDKVNGGNYWHGHPVNRDRIVSQKLAIGECTPRSSEILNECLWIHDEKDAIMSDKRRFVINIIDDQTYTLDSYIEMTALTEVVCDKTNHGLFGVRTENDISVVSGGVMINSEGQQTEANTHNQSARWMAAYGKREGRDDGLIEGLAIMTPPFRREPFNKNLWFTRDYGNFSPMPFDAFAVGEKFVMPQGDVLKLAYRIVAFTGTPTTTFLNNQWDEFAALSQGKIS